MFPNSPTVETLVAEGDALRDDGKLDEALAMYDKAIAMAPDSALPHFKRAVALGRKKDANPDDVEAAYRRALQLNPGYYQAANNLAHHLLVRRAGDQAEELFRLALAEAPDYYDPHFNFGKYLAETNRYREAAYYLQRARALRPDLPQPYHHLGELWSKLNKLPEAIALLEHAVEIAPNDPMTWNVLAGCHMKRGDFKLGMDALKKSVAIDPHTIAAWRGLAHATNYFDCDKSESFGYHREMGRVAQLRATQAGDIRLGNDFALRADPTRRLRVGFVSGDLRMHSVFYFVDGILPRLDHRDFELHAFYTYSTNDGFTEKIRHLFHYWHEMSYVQADAFAKKIRDEKIDVLIDLSGHTNHTMVEVFARRLAPIQMTWIGYPNTTGIEAVDYRLTDSWADPPNLDDKYYTEQLIRLPRSFLCYSPLETAPAVSESPVLSNGYVTFGSFNQRMKISDRCVALWARVMHAVPDSRLLLKAIMGLGIEDREAVLEAFEKHGIGRDRISMLSVEPSPEMHLARYAEMDIALDTFPYNGTTTTCEALWMGVPVVALEGDRHAARVGVSLLNNAGFPEWVAATEDEFVKIASKLAENHAALSEIRSTLRPRLKTSPLLDAASMARDLEATWRSVWQIYCDSVSPNVPPSDLMAGDMSQLMRVHVGKTQADGWQAVDSHMALSNLAAESCGEIYSCYNLQCVGPGEILEALAEVYRVLSPGGKFYLSVPDLEALASLVASEEVSGPAKFELMRLMFGTYDGAEEQSRIGLYFELLLAYLGDIGFGGVEHVESFGLFEDQSEARFQDGTLLSLNLLVSK